MKIGVLSQWFDPETGPAALPGVYSREFLSQGHEVRVLTGFPNYPEGRLYPGYSMRARLRESQGGVPITRVALYPNHSRSAVGRILNYASFGLSASILSGGALRGMDALWVYNSPITVSLPMLTHSRMGRTPIFLHVQDLWPDSLVESGMFPGGWLGDRAARLVGSIVRFTEKRSAVIGVISQSVRDVILERNPGLDPSRIVYVPNPANETLFFPVGEIRSPLRMHSNQDVVEFMYAGAIGEVQGFDTLLDAAALLADRSDLKFTLIGDGIARTRLEERVRVEKLTNVHFTGRIAQSEIPARMAAADVQMVCLGPNPFLRHTTPSKVPSLLASGVPILGQLEGDGASLLMESGAATVVRPGDANGLAEAVASFVGMGPTVREKMGAAGRRFYESHLSSRSAAEKIVHALTCVGAGT